MYPYTTLTATATVIAMAAEPEEVRSPEPPVTRSPATATATAAEAPTTTTAHPYADNAAPPPKRQRRPSVRLGEIGDQRATLPHHSHTRRPSMPPWNWKDSSPSSKSARARSFTNLANGVVADSPDFQDSELPSNLYTEGTPEFENRKAKAKKRGSSTTKRVRRSNWVPRSDDGAEGDNGREEDGDEGGFRDFDPGHSPVHSVHEVSGFRDSWHTGRHRVSDSGDRNLESDSGDRKSGRSEGVRSWLIELGLSRYAPMFEIHEVDDELLPMLTLEDLKDMGISAVGSRRKMYAAIQKLRKGFPSP